MKKKKTNHGGAREGAGRPVDPNSKVTLSVRVPIEIREYLNTTGNISQSVADVVGRSKGFKTWRKANA